MVKLKSKIMKKIFLLCFSLSVFISVKSQLESKTIENCILLNEIKLQDCKLLLVIDSVIIPRYNYFLNKKDSNVFFVSYSYNDIKTLKNVSVHHLPRRALLEDECLGFLSYRNLIFVFSKNTLESNYSFSDIKRNFCYKIYYFIRDDGYCFEIPILEDYPAWIFNEDDSGKYNLFDTMYIPKI